MKNRKHAHYFRNVAHLSELDVYRVLDLFGVTDQALGHAIKKLLAPGGRGAGKDFRRDVQEAVDTLTRRLEMLDEDAAQDFEADVVVPVNAGDGRLSFDGDWTPWSGGSDAPVGPSVVVECKRRNMISRMGHAATFNWCHNGLTGDILAYRVVVLP